MSEISYYFDLPPPRYFRENGWFKNPKSRLFIYWAFERCSQIERVVHHDNKDLILKPYQFIFGRKICADELGLSESEVRNQVNNLVNQGFLKNATNSTTKRYSIYEWVETRFSKVKNQVNNQVTTKSRPSNRHNQKNREERNKENHHPSPSSFSASLAHSSPALIDDSFSIENENAANAIEAASAAANAAISKKAKSSESLIMHVSSKQKSDNILHSPPVVHEMFPNVFLTQTELDECIRIKGSEEAVKNAIKCIMTDSKRKFKIKDWPGTLIRWDTTSSKSNPKVKDNENMALRLTREFDLPQKGNGYCCHIHVDKKKDQKGILFEAQGGYVEPIFIPLIDPEFKEKVFKVIREKRMQKGRFSNP